MSFVWTANNNKTHLMARLIPISDVKRGQYLEAKTEAKNNYEKSTK